MGKEGVVLKYHADASRFRSERPPPARGDLAIQPNLPSQQRLETGDRTQHGGLAAAAGPEQAHDFTAWKLQRKVIDRNPAAVRLADANKPKTPSDARVKAFMLGAKTMRTRRLEPQIRPVPLRTRARSQGVAFLRQRCRWPACVMRRCRTPSLAGRAVCRAMGRTRAAVSLLDTLATVLAALIVVPWPPWCSRFRTCHDTLDTSCGHRASGILSGTRSTSWLALRSGSARSALSRRGW